MNKKSLLLIATLFLLSGIIQSCKKEEDVGTTLDQQTRQFNDDSNVFKSESDQADNDIIETLKEIPAFGRMAGVHSIPVCGLTIDC